MQTPTVADEEQVERFLEATRTIELWVDGGWGVDALLRRQTRVHADLDLIIARQDAERLKQLLESLDFALVAQDGFVYRAATGLTVDIHCVRFDERGYGHFDLPQGGSWPLPPSAFRGRGVIGATPVQCLSPEAQVQCHAQGYTPTAKDLDDMAALQEAFEVVLPLSLCR